MTSAATTRLVIADDHPLFRDALRHAVAGVMTSAKIDEAGSFDELTSMLEQDSEVDLILLDLTMPGISGFSGLIYLRAQYPGSLRLVPGSACVLNLARLPGVSGTQVLEFHRRRMAIDAGLARF